MADTKRHLDHASSTYDKSDSTLMSAGTAFCFAVCSIFEPIGSSRLLKAVVTSRLVPLVPAKVDIILVDGMPLGLLLVLSGLPVLNDVWIEPDKIEAVTDNEQPYVFVRCTIYR